MSQQLLEICSSLPRYFSDTQNIELERNPLYTRMGGKCPVCRDTGTFCFIGEDYECPTDEYGMHPMRQLFKLFCLANLPMEYQTLSWEDYPHPDAKEKAEKYLANYESARLAGMGWQVMGRKLGIGKTWLVTHVLKSLLIAGYTGWFISFMELKGLFEMEDAADRDRIRAKIMGVEFLVIDDILKPKSDRARAFFEDQLEVVIRHRTSNNLPTGVTSNMEEAEIEREFPRIWSLLSAKSFKEVLTGTDFRTSGAFVSNEELVLNGEVRPLTW